MQFSKNRILAAVLALGLPVAAVAQTSSVVPPPTPPGPASNASAQPAPAPTVLPPTSASSVNPAAAVQGAAPMAPPPLIDIALPAAPKPVHSTGDLKPTVPKQTAKKSAKARSIRDADVPARVKTPVDPFAGIVGTPVSDSQLNRFVFPEAVEGIFFQEGAPLPECPEKAHEMDPCKPVFLNGKRVMLLQLRAGAKGPVQMVVHMKSGQFTTMNLMPAAGPGAVIRVDGAEDGASDARLADSKSKAGARGAANSAGGMTMSEQNTETLARLARGDIPAGFEPVAVDGKPVRFELFDVSQRATWDNGAGLRLHLMQVKAHGATPVVISPALFRKENIKALALDRETITQAEPALLYMLEQVPTETN